MLPACGYFSCNIKHKPTGILPVGFYFQPLTNARLFQYNKVNQFIWKKGVSPMKCVSCGAELADNMKFCTLCGTPVAKPTPPVVEAPPVVETPVVTPSAPDTTIGQQVVDLAKQYLGVP